MALSLQSELSEAARQAIDPFLQLFENAVSIGRTPIQRKNSRRLLNGQSAQEMLLDNEVINYYFARLMDRCESHSALPKIHCFSSHFFNYYMKNTYACKIN
jgi:hypothetical protein